MLQQGCFSPLFRNIAQNDDDKHFENRHKVTIILNKKSSSQTTRAFLFYSRTRGLLFADFIKVCIALCVADVTL
jgi:hypothetical protein